MTGNDEKRTSEIRMIAQSVVDERYQLCAAINGSDLQRWSQLEKRLTAFIEEEKEQREKSDKKLDAAIVDIVRIDQRWRNLPTIVTVTAVMSTIALIVSVAAIVIALMG